MKTSHQTFVLPMIEKTIKSLQKSPKKNKKKRRRKMYLMYYLNEDGKRVYTLKVRRRAFKISFFFLFLSFFLRGAVAF